MTNEATARQTDDPDALFGQYVDVINRVISEGNDLLYGKAAKLWGKTFGDEPITVGVYTDDADAPERWYSLKLSGGRFAVLENRKDPAAKMKWKIKQAHLEHVVDNPDEYVNHPRKLDLDWLKTRVGLC